SPGATCGTVSASKLAPFPARIGTVSAALKGATSGTVSGVAKVARYRFELVRPPSPISLRGPNGGYEDDNAVEEQRSLQSCQSRANINGSIGFPEHGEV